MIFNVSDVAGLQNALSSAKSGDTIAMASGAYSSIYIRGVNIEGGVNITSSDAGRPAVFQGIEIRDSSGLNFSNIEMRVAPAGIDNQFVVMQSRDIHFDNIDVHGTLNGSPADDNAGLMIRLSTDVTVKNSEFHELHHGLTILESSGVVVSENKFHDIRSDGVRGSGASDVQILSNYFTDFFPQGEDHPDAIQFWEGIVNPISRNILIEGNVIARGDGGLMQGIFLRGPGTTFEGVKIIGNTIAGGMTNGVYLGNARDSLVSDNTVVGHGADKSWIRVEESSNIAVTDNSSTKFIFGTAVYNLTDTGNTLVGYITTESLKALEAWIEGDQSTAMPTVSLTTGEEIGGVTPIPPVVSPALKLVGTSGVDNLVVSGEGDTRVEAGAGDDRLTGGDGQNTLLGGAGSDTYYISDNNDLVVESANAGDDLVVASVNYTLTANVEKLQLLSGATVGTGNDLANVITGSAEGDQLSGMGGNDKLLGMAGRDILRGGDGADTLTGGAGADTLSGGSGADIFTYGAADFAGGVSASMDRIEDFSSAQGDRIHLSSIDAKLNTAVNEAFSFIGSAAFRGKAGELRYQVSNGDVHVFGDVNGDKVADFQIHLVGVKSLSAIDFVL